MHLTLKRALRVVHRVVGPMLPPTLLARRYPGVPGRIHIDDQMLASDAADRVRHYVDDARSAMTNLEESLAACGRRWADVGACLDLPSGYGRVTRWLAQRLDPGAVTAADVDAQAVRFCAAEFGVRPLPVPRDVRALRLPQSYDLVFTGSLLTHLPPEDGYRLLETLIGALASAGLLVFSTQGSSCLRHLDVYGPCFAKAADHYRDGLARDGVAYLDYPRHRDYGITLHRAARLRAVLQDRFADGVELVRYAERGWDAHQDVWSLRRLPRGPLTSRPAGAPAALA
ncbi:MAG: class I SAM-dependent methyltransferase [bacterium]|nr:class I SAM-dependent methyltransferase [bacterium]